MSVPVLIGERITLRPPRPSDGDERRALGRSPEIMRGYGIDLAGHEDLTEADAAATYSAMTRDPHGWAIEREGRLIGYIGLHGVDEHDRRAMLRIGMFDDRELGKGYGTEAVVLVSRHAFDALDLHRLSLRVLATNTRAIRCYEKCGFRHEGRERESARVGRAWVDDIVMGLIRSDLES